MAVWDGALNDLMSVLNSELEFVPERTTFSLLLCRSLVEDDDAHMKVALGYGDMGISAHLQASKTGNTRFFTSNTHSSVVLQVGFTFYFLLYVCIMFSMSHLTPAPNIR